MNYMTDFTALNAYIPHITIGLIILVIILLIIVLRLHSKVNSLKRRYQRMMQGMEGVNIERLMIGHIDEVRGALVKVERLEHDVKQLENKLLSCIRRAGVVRFNAFEDTGSDLSFAAAFLDHHNSGIVMSSLYNRDECRIYAKPVINGQSSYLLTEEERQAIRQVGAEAVKIADQAGSRDKISPNQVGKGLRPAAVSILTTEEKDALITRK